MRYVLRRIYQVHGVASAYFMLLLSVRAVLSLALTYVLIVYQRGTNTWLDTLLFSYIVRLENLTIDTSVHNKSCLILLTSLFSFSLSRQHNFYNLSAV